MKTLPPFQHPSVNWVDGMKIRRQHFLEQENCFLDRIQDLAAFNAGADGFGLLPAANTRETSFILTQETEELILTHCRAVTPGGLRIEILPGFSDPLKLNIKDELRRLNIENEQGPLNIALICNPWKRVPAGEIDPSESPARQPYAQPQVVLEIIPSFQAQMTRQNPHTLKIGAIAKSGTVWLLDQNFIPPCATLNAHPKLWEHYCLWADEITKLGEYCVQIYARHDRLQAQDLEIDIRKWTMQIMLFLADTHDRLFMLLPSQAPIFFVEYVIRLARNIRMYLKLLPQQEDQMLTYLCKHLYPPGQLTISPSEILAKLEKVLYCHYDHENLAVSLNELQEYRELLLRIFKKSTELSFKRMAEDDLHTIVPPSLRETEQENNSMGEGFIVSQEESPMPKRNFLDTFFGKNQ